MEPYVEQPRDAHRLVQAVQQRAGDRKEQRRALQRLQDEERERQDARPGRAVGSSKTLAAAPQRPAPGQQRAAPDPWPRRRDRDLHQQDCSQGQELAKNRGKRCSQRMGAHRQLLLSHLSKARALADDTCSAPQRTRRGPTKV